MEERKKEDWYDYREVNWSEVAVIKRSDSICYIIKVLPKMSNHAIEQVITSKGFDLNEIDWYRTEHL